MNADLFKAQDAAVELKLERARKTNRERDRADRAAGLPPQGDHPLLVRLRTILSALFAGIASEDWVPIHEGTAMLQDFEARMRQAQRDYDLSLHRRRAD